MEKPNLREYKATKDFAARQIAWGAYSAGDDPYEFVDEKTSELLFDKSEEVKVGDILLADPSAWRGEYQSLPFVVFRFKDKKPDSMFAMFPDAFLQYTELLSAAVPICED